MHGLLIVDMSKNNGKGQVTLLEGKFCNYIPANGKLTICKHSNGVDYWLLIREHWTNKYHRYLITKDGYSEKGVQNIGKIDTLSIGTATYSPDGIKFAIYNNIGTTLGQTLEIFDFDRCTGILSKPIVINYTGKYGAGVVFSASSRYLYVGMSDEIRQYDTKAAEIKKSGITVATSDGYLTCDGKSKLDFYNGQLAPNGKIYFNGEGCARELHVIENPDIGGIGCNVKQHAITLPTYYYSSLCNFPNYRLGKKECITATEDVEIVEPIAIYPNPAQSELNVNIAEIKENEVMDFTIYSLTGEVLLQKSNLSATNLIDINHLQNGLYLCCLYKNKILTQTQKLTILK
jgi:Secretion system C-terminal sorting domain